MKTSKLAARRQEEAWLLQEYPEIHYLLQARDGDQDALRWLQTKSEGLYQFALAFAGEKKSAETLSSMTAEQLEDVLGLVAHYDLGQWLSQKEPDLHHIFAAARGDDEAMRKLQRKRTLAKLARVLRERYQTAQPRDTAATDLAAAPVTDVAAGDVSCLVGETHLKAGEFAKAVEAFTRALETGPTADVYEGRARAYRALAEMDELRARHLRDGSTTPMQ
jgi:tetratricopeptide (TPR) repeat protein